MAHRVLFVFGTRPEAIKLCPVIEHIRRNCPDLEPRVCVTAQHREMLDQVLPVFGVAPDYDLNLMQRGQTLAQITSRAIAALETVFREANPALTVVQGDTTTTLCGALGAFYSQIPVAHVEAGLRTWDMTQPFPEEMNRVLTSRLSSLHFAATEWAAQNLRREGVAPESILITGNTGIDAVLRVSQKLQDGDLTGAGWPWLDAGRKLLVVTMHRRENFGDRAERICRGLSRLAQREDVQIAIPVHPNPYVRETVHRVLRDSPNVHLLPPLDYVGFVDLMRRACILITDSGGVQEEGPSLGKPILVLREVTERPEAVAAGTVVLVGSDPERLTGEAAHLLDDPREYQRRSVIHNPYGDGSASTRIASAVQYFCWRSGNRQYDRMRKPGIAPE
jgi:UDP-N-acetylglucosamine 2-epimerase (non-hydrolysing)